MDQLTIWLRATMAVWMLGILFVGLMSLTPRGDNRFDKNSRYLMALTLAVVIPAQQFI